MTFIKYRASSGLTFGERGMLLLGEVLLRTSLLCVALGVFLSRLSCPGGRSLQGAVGRVPGLGTPVSSSPEDKGGGCSRGLPAVPF